MGATSLHHLALGAQDVAHLAEFYRDVLGLREIVRHLEPDGGSLRSVWLDLGGGAVLMVEKADHPVPERVDGHGAGLFLLALTAESGEVESMCDSLGELGIEAERETEFTRYFRDPEGNRFALSVYPLPS